MSNNSTFKVVKHSKSIKLESKGERRFVTVLFCDLVSATSMSNQFDPEDLQQILNHFHRYCGIAINRYGGNISQLLGDGVMAYFGYPFTFEDNAHRALRSGLEIINGLQDLNNQLQCYAKMDIQVRIGIDTGLVVTSEKKLFKSGQALGVIGKTPNIAAKLQNMAEPNTILISAQTHRLVQGMFIVKDLGDRTIKGLSESIPVYNVLEESDAHSRFEAAVSFGLTPFVGREKEMRLARIHWKSVSQGAGRLMMLQGEPGIGKTRIIKNIQDDIAGIPHTTFKCFCSPFYQNSALYPLLSTLKQFLPVNEQDKTEEKISAISNMLTDLNLPVNEYLGLWAGMYSIPSSELPEIDDSVSEQKRKFAFSIIRWLENCAVKQPMLFIIEDLHCSDPSTLDLIAQIIELGLIKNILIILSCRPEFVPNWQHLGNNIQKLDCLNENNTRKMIATICENKIISDMMVTRLLNRSEGNPLFIEESTKMAIMLSSHSSATIPDTLQDLLRARLELLADSKTTAQICAVLGKSFDYDLLLAVCDCEADNLRNQVDQLLKAQILVKLHDTVNNRYEFKHALIQEACYQSLLLRNRQEYHLSIAKVLMTKFKKSTPEIIARHCTHAKLYREASYYWKMAGIESVNNSAGLEASSHFRKAIAVLKNLPSDTIRDSLELDIQVLLGAVLTTSIGYGTSEITETFERARILCQRCDDPAQLCSVLAGLWQNSLSKSQLNQCSDYALELLNLAEKIRDPIANLIANGTVGITAFVKGEFSESIYYLENAVSFYEPEKVRAVIKTIGQDPGLSCMGCLALSKEMLGESEQAEKILTQANSIALKSGHKFSLASNLIMSCFLYAMQENFEKLISFSNEVMILTRKHGFEQILSEAKLFNAYAQGKLGINPNAVDDLQAAIYEHGQSQATLNQPYYYSLLAELYILKKQYEHAEKALKYAIKMATDNTSNDKWSLSRLYKLRDQLSNSISNNTRTLLTD